MITRIASERMVIVSDMHLGNPFCTAKGQTIRFLEWASREGWDICINGDGFEVAQVSFSRLARDIPEVLHALKEATGRGSRVFYVVGNHDIVFEHFLNDWGGFTVAPFLNVESGGKRVRVEHGHLYDPFFVSSPRLYEFLTWLGGFFLMATPRVYKAWILFERLRSRLRRGKGIVGEHPGFLMAAEELVARGIDSVVFGHTHHVGAVKLHGGVYLNPGSWMLEPTYVKLEAGNLELARFI